MRAARSWYEKITPTSRGHVVAQLFDDLQTLRRLTGFKFRSGRGGRFQPFERDLLAGWLWKWHTWTVPADVLEVVTGRSQQSISDLIALHRAKRINEAIPPQLRREWNAESGAYMYTLTKVITLDELGVSGACHGEPERIPAAPRDWNYARLVQYQLGNGLRAWRTKTERALMPDERPQLLTRLTAEGHEIRFHSNGVDPVVYATARDRKRALREAENVVHMSHSRTEEPHLNTLDVLTEKVAALEAKVAELRAQSGVLAANQVAQADRIDLLAGLETRASDERAMLDRLAG
jgi:hypothetical protein